MYFTKIFIFFVSYTVAFSMKLPSVLFKHLGSTFIASTLLTSNSVNLQSIPNNHPVIKNDNQFESTTNVLVERNNIYLYGDITPESCEQLKNKLNELNFNGRLFKISYNSDPPPINIHIQSSGGTLMNSFYIVDLIESLEIPVNTYVDGY